MQSRTLSIVCVLVCILSLFAVPKSVRALSDYGPSADPVILEYEPSFIKSITCPAPVTYGCNDDFIFQTFQEFVDAGGSVNIPPECSVITFVHDGDSATPSGCSTTFLRKYKITTDCGSTFECSQIITVTDENPPTITSCPNNVTISADAMCQGTTAFSAVVAEDDCDSGSVTVSDDAPATYPIGNTTVTFTVSDACGNEATCQATVTVEDNTAPSITCPPSLTAQCDESEQVAYPSAAAFVAAGGTISDNCTSDINNFLISVLSEGNDGGSCPKTVTRVYQVTDAAGNMASCNQQIIVDDTMPPTFDGPADIMDVSCSSITDTLITGGVTNVADNCAITPTVTFSDVSVNNGGGMMTITRTFTVTDGCDNTATATQTISAVDNTPPVAVCADITVAIPLGGEFDLDAATLNGGSTNDCGGDLTFTASRQMLFCNDAALNNGIVMVDLYVENAAGLRDTCTSTVTVEDNVVPVLIAPADVTVECIADVALAFANVGDFMAGGGTLLDNCTTGGIFEVLTNTTTGNCPKVVERIYRYTDFSNNVSNIATHTITVDDTMVPTIMCPTNIVISETDICDTLLEITAIAMDNCGVFSITNTIDASTDGVLSARFGGGTTAVTFTATDSCGLTAECTMTVTVAADPKITFPPFTITGTDNLPSYADFDEFVAAGGSINEFCGLDPADFVYTATFALDAIDKCVGLVTETVTFDDGVEVCTESRTNTIMDTLAPVLDCSNITTVFLMQSAITCVADVVVPQPASVTDNFGVETLVLRDFSMDVDTTTTYWVATDSCGNADSCAVEIIILDTSSPIFLIDTAEVMCEAMIPQYATLEEFLASEYNPTVMDCNLDSTSFAFVGDTIVGGTPGKIYMIMDTKGNMSTEVHFYTIMDGNSPMIDNCSTPVIMAADAGLCTAAVTIPALDVTDNCDDDDLTITNSFNGTDNASGTYPVGTTSVTWTVTDGSSDPVECTFTVTINDEENPTIACPTAGVDQCNISALPPAADIDAFIALGGTVSDNCKLDSTSFSVTTTVMSAGPCPIIYERTYAVSDSSGNMNNCTQLITIDDTEVPTFTPPTMADVTVATDINSCVATLTFSAPVPADNCGIDSIYNNLTTTVDVTAFDFPLGITNVAFTAVDSCDNEAVFSFDVNVVDQTSPTFNIDPTDAMCEEMFPTFASFSAFDAFTSANPVAEDCQLDTASFTYLLDTMVMGQFGRKYSIADSSGNVSTIVHLANINDTTQPTVTCAADITVSNDTGMCSAFVTIPAPQVVENCMGSSVTITNDGNGSGDDDASGTYPVGPTTVTYFVMDGNTPTASCSVNILVEDTMDPEISCPADSLLYACSIDDFPAPTTFAEFIAAGGAVSDNCDINEMSFSSTTTITDVGPCPRIYDRKFIIEDIYGNKDSCVQVITVQDTIAPDITITVDTLIAIAAMDMCGIEGITPSTVTITDNCGLLSTIETNDNPLSDGTFFPVGFTKITFTATDTCGNTAVDSLVVEVRDTIDPELIVPIDTLFTNCTPVGIDTIELPNDINQQGGNLFDACGFEVELVSLVGTDTITATYTATDPSGNSIEFTQVAARTDFDGPAFDSLPDPMMAIECGEAFPPQEVLTATDPSGVFSIEQDTLPFDMNICNDREVTYVWTATDNCGNTSEVEASFDINRDETAPQIATPLQDITISNNTGLCGFLRENLTAPSFVDDCSGLDTTYTTFSQELLKVGVSNVGWVAEDSCGNVSMEVTQLITVEDNESPVLACDSFVPVSLTVEASNLVHVESFVNDADDNCSVDTMLVRRLTTVCEDPLSNTFRDVVRFCCEEVGDTVMVEVLIRDAAGNENTCMSSAVISDKLSPTISRSLPDITISCGYDLDTLDLSEFGTLVFDEADRDTIFLDDQYYGPTGFAGRDGLVNENCTAVVTDSVVVDIDNNCNVGTVRRIFTVTDMSGNKTTTDQLITIIDFDPFYIDRNDDNNPNDDIIWPATFTWDQCLSPAPDTTIAGAPVFLNNDQCSAVSATFRDLEFNIGNGGCAYIRRIWKVIDWCQFDPTTSPNPGEWTYEQDIYVNNVTAPVFTEGEQDTVICAPGSFCVGTVSLSASATDDCTAPDKLIYSYVIDTGSNGPSGNISGNGSSFTRTFNQGTHTVTWKVSDLCGNTTERTDVFTVRDCKLPNAVCYSGINISLGNNGTVEVWASDIDRESSDNCTAKANLKLSFSTDPDDFGRIYTCDDLGPNTVSLYVTDEAGNQSNCTAVINIQDNANECGGNITTTVTGQVLTYAGTPVADAKISIQGAELSDYSLTDELGNYAFQSLDAETNVELSVEKDGDYLEGVNTLDIVKIQRHLLGIENLDSPYKLIAADATNDERVSAKDMLALRKLILGLSDGLENTESWRFVSTDTPMEDEEQPWPFEEAIHVDYGNLLTDGDFVAVKVGDVNRTIDELLSNGGIESRSVNYLGLSTENQIFNEGTEVNVPLYINSAADLEAIQFTISYDVNKLRFVDIENGHLELTAEHSATPEDGKITLSWNTAEPLSLVNLSRLLNVRFEAVANGVLKGNLAITSDITRAQAYSQDEAYEVNLDFINDVDYEIFLYQNKPNPFFGETVVEVDVPEAMEVDFTIFDATGKIYMSKSEYLPAGTSSMIVGEELGGKRGVFYLKMDAAEFSQVIKMIKIE